MDFPHVFDVIYPFAAPLTITDIMQAAEMNLAGSAVLVKINDMTAHMHINEMIPESTPKNNPLNMGIFFSNPLFLRSLFACVLKKIRSPKNKRLYLILF